jgi:ATP-dependent protease ClpP protease subunit
MKIGSVLALLLLSANIPNNQQVTFEGEVSDEMLLNIKAEVNDSIVEDHQLVYIDSPGGSVASLNNILDILGENKYDTYVNNMAASAAADTFMSAKGKIYATPGAMILLHGSRIIVGGIHVTAPMIREALDAGKITDPGTREEYENIYKMLQTTNETLFQRVMDRHPNVNKDMAREVVFGNMEKDRFFSATELKEMGFDIIIEKPDFKSYEKVRLGEVVLKFLKKLFM